MPEANKKTLAKTTKADQDAASKALKILDEGAPANGDGFLGVDYPISLAKLVLLPAPWDATTSYGQGASLGPDAILKASHQIDAFDLTYGKPYQDGIAWDDSLVAELESLNKKARLDVSHVRKAAEGSSSASKASEKSLHAVQLASEKVNELVYLKAKEHLDKGRKVAVVGGDHSCPLGLMKALNDRYKEFGILHIDAHFDLRVAYEGFQYSHASIMYNALQECSSIVRLVPVGIRDFSAAEFKVATRQGSKVRSYFDQDLSKLFAQGITFQDVTDQVIRELPEHVYISFDIDGLDPSYCPSTGTPVPGGLSYAQACYLLESLVDSKRHIIGFDLSEVAPDPSGNSEWDANVGARLCYKMCGAMLRS